MPEEQAPASHPWLAEEWSKQFAHVMESMTGEALHLTFAPHNLASAEIDPAQTEMVWWEQPFSSGPDAIAWIGGANKSWEEIGNRVLRSAGVDDGDRETIRSTYLEIVSQTLSGVAGTISKRTRREVSCLEGRSSPPPSPTEAEAYGFEISFPEAAIAILVAFSSSLGVLPDAPQENSPKAVLAPAPPPAHEETQPTHPIDLLLDVELPVSISFGRAQLPLKDVIKLTTGSIVELNRSVSEPVEIIVNNCVIARGEVVVVEGNFGVRIRQVISRQERLRTLT